MSDMEGRDGEAGELATEDDYDEPTSAEGSRLGNPPTAAQLAAGMRGVIMPEWPRHWLEQGVPRQPSESEMWSIREAAAQITTYIAPEMTEFVDFDEYMTRFLKTADRIADWVKDGV